MNKEELVNYLDQYMNYSSYLLWGNDTGDISPILNVQTLLANFKTQYIFAALNQCNSVSKYTNFHNPKKAGDTKLMNTIKMRNRFEGCFITDVFAGKEFETINGKELKELFKKDKTLKQRGINDFLARIKPLLDMGAVIIAFGDDCYKNLVKYTNLQNRIYKIPHYSSSKTYEERCEALDKVLKDLLK